MWFLDLSTFVWFLDLSTLGGFLTSLLLSGFLTSLLCLFSLEQTNPGGGFVIHIGTVPPRFTHCPMHGKQVGEVFWGGKVIRIPDGHAGDINSHRAPWRRVQKSVVSHGFFDVFRIRAEPLPSPRLSAAERWSPFSF